MRPDQTGLDRFREGRIGFDWLQPYQTGSNRFLPAQTTPDRLKTVLTG